MKLSFGGKYQGLMYARDFFGFLIPPTFALDTRQIEDLLS